MATQRWQEEVKQEPPDEHGASARARAVANGLVRTKRAARRVIADRGTLRLACRKGGYYWVSLDGNRLRRGKELFDAEELQPTFIDAMERAGR